MRHRKCAAVLALAALSGACSVARGVDPRPEPRPVALRELNLAGPWHYLPYNGPDLFADPDVDDRAWPTMRLPSNWYLLGRDAYPARADKPISTEHNPGGLWPVDVERGLDWSGTVWFRRTVEWQGTADTPVLLELDMVDYYTDVFVNGQLAGSHEGYFQRWAVDVSPYLRPGPNTIALRVGAPALPFDMAAQLPISWPKHQNQIKGIFSYHDTRPGATTFRGQERATGGVLRGVVLRQSTGVEIEHLLIHPRDVSSQSAWLDVEAVVRNWTDRPVPVEMDGVVLPANFQADTRLPVSVRGTAAPGTSRLRTTVRMEQPALWWSWDYGAPNLYRLEARLANARSGMPLHFRTERFGVRSITLGEDWVWRLNGERIYPRGSNYIATQWLSQADRAWFERDAALMRDANLNSIRVHAHVTRPEFYEVADSLGIMVWQDYPLQWGYTDRPEFHREALRQAEDMIVRLGNHPSVIVWSMHNEPPWAMEWMKKRDPDQNKALDAALFALARQLDSSRVVIQASGLGDGHPYHGWYGGKVSDFGRGTDEPFVTEYGAQALPDVASLRRMFEPDSVWPRDPSAWAAWRYHNFQPEQTFDIAGIPTGDSIAEFVAFSQRYQANLVRFATEGFRRRKWRGSTGIYHFMLVDDWPAITWSVLDYWRQPKTGYYALQRAMQPVLPSIEYAISDPAAPLTLHVVNDLHRAFPAAKLRWRVVAADGERGPLNERVLDVPANSAFSAVPLGSMPAVTQGAATLVAWLESAAGELLGRTTLTADDFWVPSVAPR